ncbi:MAG: deoxynucleoside kinase [Oscillospiraceae bacterium]|nr:deoxynucleoside kinase [Oscillospiraceae bacterium]
MKGKLVVIEGLDGSGKSTQIALVKEKLEKDGFRTRRIKLPDYSSPSSTLVRMYLSGELGNAPGDVNAYAASAFYAVDRIANYLRVWRDGYLDGELILADRYTTSNAYHQMTKLPYEQWDGYLAWLEDFEYGKLAIPKPDLVIYFDMPPDVSRKLISGRYGGDESRRDIHEADTDYLESCGKAARYAADKLGWRVIRCAENGGPLAIKDIADQVYQTILGGIT